MAIQTFEAGIEPKQETPCGDIVLLDRFPYWNNLEEIQKLFISNYFKYFPRKTVSIMATGISMEKFNEWESNPDFIKMYNIVRTLHAESLNAIDYRESYNNPKIRGRQLKALGQEGFSDKTNKVTNNTLVIQGAKTLDEVAKSLKSS